MPERQLPKQRKTDIYLTQTDLHLIIFFTENNGMGFEKNGSFFVQFTGKEKAAIQSSGCILDVVLLEVDRNSMVSFNVGLL